MRGLLEIDSRGFEPYGQRLSHSVAGRNHTRGAFSKGNLTLKLGKSDERVSHYLSALKALKKKLGK